MLRLGKKQLVGARNSYFVPGSGDNLGFAVCSQLGDSNAGFTDSGLSSHGVHIRAHQEGGDRIDLTMCASIRDADGISDRGIGNRHLRLQHCGSTRSFLKGIESNAAQEGFRYFSHAARGPNGLGCLVRHNCKSATFTCHY
jgi:hypothetical protein